PQGDRDLLQATGTDPVVASLVFANLLHGDTDLVGQLLLRQTQREPLFPYSHADVLVSWCRVF
ncbi:MAG TPA: hypothetical protein VGG64_10690, partial [Pirellulales bacterium]